MFKKLLLLLIFFSNYAIAESETIPYELKDGDVISASVINDILRKIEQGTNGFITPAEIVGTNKCIGYSVKEIVAAQNFGMAQPTDNSSLISRENDMIVTEDNGAYTVTFSNYNPFKPAEPTASYKFEIAGNYFFMIQDRGGDNVSVDDLRIQKTAPNRFNFTLNLAELVCEIEKKNPEIPSELTATVGNNNNVTFEWKDNSDNETAFDLVVIDSDEQETVVETTSADTNTAVVPMNTDGQFELRVKAKNDAGESLGSNAVVITVEDGVAEVF